MSLMEGNCPPLLCGEKLDQFSMGARGMRLLCLVKRELWIVIGQI